MHRTTDLQTGTQEANSERGERYKNNDILKIPCGEIGKKKDKRRNALEIIPFSHIELIHICIELK